MCIFVHVLKKKKNSGMQAQVFIYMLAHVSRYEYNTHDCLTNSLKQLYQNNGTLLWDELLQL